MTSQSRPSGAPHAGHPRGTKLLSFLHHFLGHYLRQLRWSEGVCCPRCESGATIKRGFDGHEQHLQRYECKSCGQRAAAD